MKRMERIDPGLFGREMPELEKLLLVPLVIAWQR